MRLLRPFAAAIAAVCVLALPASAKLLIEIDKSAQRMTVSQDGAQLYVWPVSTGQRGYDTPGGAFTPFRMEKDHFSREWDDAPMPHSIFFTTRATPSTAPSTPATSGGRRRMAACGSSRRTPACCSAWSSRRAWPTSGSCCSARPARGGPAMVRRAPQYNPPGYDDDVTGYRAAAPRLSRRHAPGAGRDDDGYRRMPPPPPPSLHGAALLASARNHLGSSRHVTCSRACSQLSPAPPSP